MGLADFFKNLFGGGEKAEAPAEDKQPADNNAAAVDESGEEQAEPAVEPTDDPESQA